MRQESGVAMVYKLIASLEAYERKSGKLVEQRVTQFGKNCIQQINQGLGQETEAPSNRPPPSLARIFALREIRASLLSDNVSNITSVVA